jgi:hypothetical protein
VRSKVAQSKRVPDDILEKLRMDDVFSVRKCADWEHERRIRENGI